jgi:hypothetical protein
MAVILGATYPNIFAAIAVGSGLEYQAATSTISAYTAMSSGGPNPVTQGDVAYKEQGAYSRPLGVSFCFRDHRSKLFRCWLFTALPTPQLTLSMGNKLQVNGHVPTTEA